MATAVTGEYLGNKRVRVRHEESGAVFETDAPKDNQGEGRRFSPTDLIGTALGSCILTVMAIKAEQKGFAFQGASFAVQKFMQASPRRIAELRITIGLPASLDEEQRRLLEAVADTCPVHRSLHPEMKITVTYNYSIR